MKMVVETNSGAGVLVGVGSSTNKLQAETTGRTSTNRERRQIGIDAARPGFWPLMFASFPSRSMIQKQSPPHTSQREVILYHRQLGESVRFPSGLAIALRTEVTLHWPSLR